MKSSLLKIGKIVGHHGIKGELKLHPYSDDPSRISKLSEIYIGDEESRTVFKMDGARLHKSNILVRLHTYDTIEKGLGLVGKEVFAERSQLDSDEGHFIVDLIGCNIFSTDDEYIGVLKDVVRNPAHDLYEVGLDNGKLAYIPVVDEFVYDIDVDNRKITVKLIDGLIEAFE